MVVMGFGFGALLMSKVIAFVAWMPTGNPWVFATLICYILLCYGGGFGVMPSFVLNTFGARLMPVLYGAILTAWSAGGIVGPQVVAWLKDRHGAQASAHAFALGAILLAVGTALSWLCRDPGKKMTS